MAASPDEGWEPNVYVVARFLQRLWRPEWEPAVEVPRARLQMAVGLNYDRYKRYLNLLIERGLVSNGTNQKGDSVVRLTLEGREAYETFAAWVRQVLGPQGSR